MKQERILVWSETGKKQDLVKSITNVMDKANELIEQYNEVQPWERIETVEAFQKLYDDPLKLLDDTLRANIDLKIAGNRMPNASALASLLSVNRTAYMKALGISEPSKDEDCEGCKGKTQTVRVQRIRAVAEFSQYTKYLYFINGLFILNTEAINEYCKEFDIWAENPEQLKLVNHWSELARILNKHNELYPMGPTHELNICKALKLQQLDRKFLVNQMALSEQVKYLKT